ncbi:MAG: ATP-binding protein, partial [Planctomycetaceae bacterium]|nr:ATP-binding protein [Planctomycetaceae bacterium]
MSHSQIEQPRTGPISAEALARLDFLQSRPCGCGVLQGPACSGKSALLRELAVAADRIGALVAHVDGQSLDARGLLWELAAEWQIAPTVDAHSRRLTQDVRDFVHGSAAAGRRIAILLDHADRMEHTAGLTVARLLHECAWQQGLMLIWAANSPLQGDAADLLLPFTELRIDCPLPTTPEIADYARAVWGHSADKDLLPQLAEQLAGLSRSDLRRAERLSRLSQLTL